MFIPIFEDGKRVEDFYVAEFNPRDGTFWVSGKDGRGMPPGKYRITVEVLEHHKDVFKGAFDQDRSPFVRDVDAHTSEVVLDVEKPNG
jgi:hypothetical protein